jgi:hypothetical protein
MAKKQTRRSISVSRTTYERLKAFCETNNISMSQLVETRVNDFLGPSDVTGAHGQIQMVTAGAGTAGIASAGAAMAGGVSAGATVMPSAPRPFAPRPVVPAPAQARPVEPRPAPVQPSGPVGSVAGAGGPPPPMTSAAARFAVDPPPPIIKPRQDTAAPKPAEKRPEQIFTF